MKQETSKGKHFLPINLTHKLERFKHMFCFSCNFAICFYRFLFFFYQYPKLLHLFLEGRKGKRWEGKEEERREVEGREGEERVEEETMSCRRKASENF